jgi:GNAT superfamily N-acetyltransferase
MTGGSPVAPHITYRNATEADIEAEHAVFVAAEGELLRRHGYDWPPPPLDRVAATLGHLLAHDAERCFVAVSDGRVVGYSAVFVREDTSYLAALFVDPACQGMGIGQQLFARSFEGAPAKRMTISDAIQPVSNAIYARNGLIPVTPVLGFEGRARITTRSDLVPSRPDAASLAALDRAAYGFDRAIDHAFWSAQATPTLWLRDGHAVAYSYRWPTGRIGPLVGRDSESAAAALVAGLEEESPSTIQVPGTSRSLVRTALAAGLRLTAPAGLLLVSAELEPPRLLAISSYGLM